MTHAFQAGNASSNLAGDTATYGNDRESGEQNPPIPYISAQNSSRRPHGRNLDRALPLDATSLCAVLVACARLNFLGRIAPPDRRGCSLWTGGRNSRGYGKVYLGGPPGRFYLAHRVSWFLARGEIPAGMTIDHRCSERRCQSVEHVELVTLAENSRRANVNRRPRRLAQLLESRAAPASGLAQGGRP